MITRLRAIRVDFQPSLTNPATPVPLGVVLHGLVNGVGTIFLLGKQLRRDRPRPTAFQAIGELGYELVTRWCKAFVNDIEEVLGTEDDPLGFLCSRWHSNLYVTAPEPVKMMATERLLDAALRLYKDHVQEEFPRDRFLPRGRPRARKSGKPRRRLTSLNRSYRHELLDRRVSA